MVIQCPKVRHQKLSKWVFLLRLLEIFCYFINFFSCTSAEYALLFGPVEVTSILLFSLTFIAALSGDSLIKGLIAGLFGLLFSTVGMEIETATVRFTFGILELFDGLSLIPVAIGMLAVAEMFVQLGV